MTINRLSCGIIVAVALLSGQAAAQESADVTVRRVLEELRHHHPQAVWQALPASYQGDLEGLIHEFAAQADAEIWNLTFGVLNKAVRVLDEKREFIFEQPLVAARLQDTPEPDAAYDAVLTLVSTLTSSELSDVQRLRTLDPEAFLSGTVSRLMQQAQALRAALPDAQVPLEELENTTITLVSSDGDQAVVRIESDGESEDREFVRVEGKWIPRELAADWEKNIAEARLGVAELAARQRSPETEQVVGLMHSINGTLDQMLAAQTTETFEQSLQQLMGTVMFQIMSLGAGMEEQEAQEAQKP